MEDTTIAFVKRLGRYVIDRLPYIDAYTYAMHGSIKLNQEIDASNAIEGSGCASKIQL